jgi:hypothetical protein
MDRTAQTEPLTTGQSIVAKWESPASPWSEPADLAEAIDKAIAAEREACARIADERERTDLAEQRAWEAGQIAKLIRARST